MKVAIVAPSALPARRANTIQVMKMAQAFMTLGHQVRVAAPGSVSARGNGQEDAAEWARWYGLHQHIQVDGLLCSPHLRRYDYGLRALSWARRWGADLLYTRLPQAAAWSSQRGFPVIYELHDFPAGRMAGWLLRLFLRGRGARRLVVISHALSHDLVERLNTPSQPPFSIIAPDGIDLERYARLPSPLEARRKLPADIQARLKGFTAGYSGHLYAGRGIEVILKLAEALPQVSFLIAGGEPQDVAWVQRLANERDLHNIVLVGFIPNADLPLYQASCEALLMPYQEHVSASSGGDISRYLSPMKLFEYLACGRVILSSDLPVLREILTPENSILLPPHDVPAWIAATQRVQGDRQLRDRLATAARAEAGRYTWEERATRLLSGLEEDE